MEKFIGSGKIFFFTTLNEYLFSQETPLQNKLLFFRLFFLLQDDLTNLKFK